MLKVEIEIEIEIDQLSVWSEDASLNSRRSAVAQDPLTLQEE